MYLKALQMDQWELSRNDIDHSACPAHSFACFALLVLVTHSDALIYSLAQTAQSLAPELIGKRVMPMN